MADPAAIELILLHRVRLAKRVHAVRAFDDHAKRRPYPHDPLDLPSEHLVDMAAEADFAGKLLGEPDPARFELHRPQIATTWHRRRFQPFRYVLVTEDRCG